MTDANGSDPATADRANPEPATRAARATIRTTHDDAATAERVAAAVAPDNTDEMTTRVDGATVETTVERDTATSLRATADDYVVNLRVATGLSDSDPTDEQREST